MANIITLVKIVIAPTATSPPYFNREELKHTEMILSLACIINPDNPRVRLGTRMEAFGIRWHLRIRRLVFFPKRKQRTQIQDRAWERIVASAAPFTPIWKPKIRIGSRTILVTAPINTDSIPVFANPWAVINAFMPRVSWTKMVPSA